MENQLASKQDAIDQVNSIVAQATEGDSFMVAVFRVQDNKVTVDRVSWRFPADELPIAAAFFAKQMQDEQAATKAAAQKEPHP